MRFKRLRRPTLLCVSIAAAAVFLARSAPALAAEKNQFRPRPAADYPHRQTSQNVTIAAQPYTTDDEAKEAFGKVNPWRYGVLPVLIVIRNDSPHALRLDRARFTYELPDGSKIQSTPASDVKFILGAKKPRHMPGPVGVVLPKGGKNPLAQWEIEGRALVAQVVPPGDSASGFVYFQTPQASDAASVYIDAIMDAVTSRDLFYFEIPLSGK